MRKYVGMFTALLPTPGSSIYFCNLLCFQALLQNILALRSLPMTHSPGLPKRFRAGKRMPLISALLAIALLLNLAIIQFASAAGNDSLALAADISASLPLMSDPTDTTGATREI